MEGGVSIVENLAHLDLWYLSSFTYPSVHAQCIALTAEKKQKHGEIVIGPLTEDWCEVHGEATSIASNKCTREISLL